MDDLLQELLVESQLAVTHRFLAIFGRVIHGVCGDVFLRFGRMDGPLICIYIYILYIV
jgi:hypothetical protein